MVGLIEYIQNSRRVAEHQLQWYKQNMVLGSFNDDDFLHAIQEYLQQFSATRIARLLARKNSSQGILSPQQALHDAFKNHYYHRANILVPIADFIYDNTVPCCIPLKFNPFNWEASACKRVLRLLKKAQSQLTERVTQWKITRNTTKKLLGSALLAKINKRISQVETYHLIIACVELDVYCETAAKILTTEEDIVQRMQSHEDCNNKLYEYIIGTFNTFSQYRSFLSSTKDSIIPLIKKCEALLPSTHAQKYIKRAKKLCSTITTILVHLAKTRDLQIQQEHVHLKGAYSMM